MDPVFGLGDAFFNANISMAQAADEIKYQWSRPSVVFRPILSLDGNAWCALLGENLQVGIAAFGDSPDEAMRNFDIAWRTKVK